MQTVCANCSTAQGPFKRMRLIEFKMPQTFSLCKRVDDCKERRKKLDYERWRITKDG